MLSVPYRSSGLAVALIAGVFAQGQAFAHHGAPGYDFSKPVNIEGTIVEVQWKNPHLYFTVDTGAKSMGGKQRILEIEAASPPQVVAFGMQRGTLKAGERVKVLAFGRLKDPDGANYKGAIVTLPDGSTYFLENSLAPALVRETIAAQALGGKWVPASTSNFGEYMLADSKARGIRGTDEQVAAQAQAGLDAARDAAANFCANRPEDQAAFLGRLPFLMAAVGGIRMMEIRENSVVMRVDSDAGVVERFIDLTQAHRQSKAMSTSTRHSVGHWEGRTLVIETAASGPGTGMVRHMVERLTLTDDRRHVRYEFTVENPSEYPQPFQFSMLWTHRPDLTMSGAACDEKTAKKFLSVQ